MSLNNIRIVLVATSHPGNIGAAARAMKTMGLSQLVLVNPLRYPDPQAEWRAAAATDVLDQCRVCARLDEAIADCHWVVGASARPRRIPWPVADVRTSARKLLAEAGAGQVAVLFGREADGLSNEELQRCNAHLRIPASPDYPSLNLAMAVQVVAYELFAAQAVPAEPEWDRPPATAAEVEAMLAHLERLLVATDFLDPDNPGQTLTRLRRLAARAGLDQTEVRMLRGIATQLEKRSAVPARRRPSSA
ncbi:MAG: RNA methyltransferase [Gammaproteobacteria bacterium]|nr:RNA methyltransferase [Gammaproteobacteria bacterium]MYH15690.1 RNA methyltransferase [Gammaproteobacteria bacterium]MYK82944.1 RNA methyltransferase [Gammaproteobacteria bacterium]